MLARSKQIKEGIRHEDEAYRTKIFDALLLKFRSRASVNKIHFFSFSYIKPACSKLKREPILESKYKSVVMYADYFVSVPTNLTNKRRAVYFHSAAI